MFTLFGWISTQSPLSKSALLSLLLFMNCFPLPLIPLSLALLCCFSLGGCQPENAEQRAEREKREAIAAQNQFFKDGHSKGYQEGYDKGLLEGEDQVKRQLLPYPGSQNGLENRRWKQWLFIFAVLKTFLFLFVISLWLVDMDGRSPDAQRSLARFIMLGTGSILAFSLAAKSGHLVDAVSSGVNHSLLFASPSSLLGEIVVWVASIVAGYLINRLLWKVAERIGDGLERAVAAFMMGFITSGFAWLGWKLAWLPDISRHVVFDIATGFMVGGLLHLGVRLHDSQAFVARK